jgi:hypothetical protein
MFMDDYNFMSEDEFIDCFSRGCEAEFMYNGKHYTITHYKRKISVMEVDNDKSERFFDTAKDALEHLVDGKRLGDILLDMEVLDRSF